MIRKLIAAGALSLALSACSSVESGITSLSNTIDQPSVQQALATVETVSTAIVCDIGSGSALAQSIEAQVGAHQGVTNLIDVSSTAVCAALKGTVVPGATQANVPAIVAVSEPVAR